MPYAIDLFCGAGGCSEGLIQAGFHILFSSDISDMVELTYTHRHEQLGLIQGKNTWFERADIRNLTGDIIRDRISSLEIFKGKKIPEIDVIFGGPSCQGFSRAGRRDKSDPRNMLFGEYVRVINEIKPRYIVLENVEGFMDMQFLGYVGIRMHPTLPIQIRYGSATNTMIREERSAGNREARHRQRRCGCARPVMMRRNGYESTCDTGCSFEAVYVRGSRRTNEKGRGGPRSVPDGYPG